MRARNLFDQEHEKGLSNSDYAWFSDLYANQIRTVDSIINTLEMAVESSKLTKAEIARKLDVEGSNIRRVFMGSNNPTLHTIADLAFVLGFDLVLIPRAKKSPTSHKSPRSKFNASQNENVHA